MLASGSSELVRTLLFWCHSPKDLVQNRSKGMDTQKAHNARRYAAQNPTSFSRYVAATKERAAMFVSLYEFMRMVLCSGVSKPTSMQHCICIAMSASDLQLPFRHSCGLSAGAPWSYTGPL